MIANNISDWNWIVVERGTFNVVFSYETKRGCQDWMIENAHPYILYQYITMSRARLKENIDLFYKT